MKFNKKSESSATSLRVGPVRLSYAKLFSPDAITEKYSVSCIIPKNTAEGREAKSLIDDAIEAAKLDGRSRKWDGKLPPASVLKTPLRDGDTERPDDPAYANSWFFNCSSKRKPNVGVWEGGMSIPAVEDEVYSGCWAAVTVSFFPYSSNGNKGVGASLGNVLKIEDGDRLGGGGETLESSFGDLL